MTGISGSFASPTAADLLAGADLVLGFGASLNNWTTKHGALIAPDAGVVQVDLDEEAIGARRPVDVGVVADAAEAAGGLLDELRRRGFRGQGLRSPALAARIARGRWRDQPYQDASTESTIDPRTLTIALDDLLPADRALAVDSGHFMGWPVMYLQVRKARSFVFNQAYQSIGLGLGAAIGAAVADPGRVTVAALGDGGTFMSLGELETAARLRLPLLLLVVAGLVVGVRLAVSIPAVVVEGRRWPQALSRSWSLVAGHWGHVLATLLLAFVAIGLVGSVLSVLLSVLIAPLALNGWLARALVQAAVDALILPYFLTVWVLLYLDLRARKEHLDLDTLRADLQGPQA